MTEIVTYGELALPPGMRSRLVKNVNGLTMHMLETGFEGENRPCVLLLHGFPELAYSWRKVMLPIASAGFHVVAPDQRGYGRTTGWDGDCAVMLRRRQERLGYLPGPRRHGENAKPCVHPDAGLSSGGRGRALGAARAAGGSEQIAVAVSAASASTR